MKSFKRIAMLGVAALMLQLTVIAPATAATGGCSRSGSTVYVVGNDNSVTLQSYSGDADEHDYLYCDGEEYLFESIDNVQVSTAPGKNIYLYIYLEDGNDSGYTGDFHGLTVDIAFGTDYNFFEIYADGIVDLSVSSANKQTITVGDGTFSAQPADISGTFTVSRPMETELEIYGSDENDVIDASKAAGQFWYDGIYIDGEDGLDVIYGSDDADDGLYGEVVYPGEARPADDDYDDINGSDLCNGDLLMVSFANVDEDLEFTYLDSGSLFSTTMEWYLNGDFTHYFAGGGGCLTGGTVLVLGSGDDTMTTGVADFWKIKAGPGDDVINGDSSNDRIYGGAGDDVLKGQAGDDILVGGKGKDKVVGGYDYDICKQAETNSSCEWIQ